MAKKTKKSSQSKRNSRDIGAFGQTFRFDSQGNLLKQKWQKPIMVLK